MSDNGPPLVFQYVLKYLLLLCGVVFASSAAKTDSWLPVIGICLCAAGCGVLELSTRAAQPVGTAKPEGEKEGEL